MGLTFYGAASPAGILACGSPGTGAAAIFLTAGAAITSAGQYNPFQAAGTEFHATSTGYLGFKFLNETTSAYNYGWMLVSTNATTGFPARILGYAYDNTGLSIKAGQTVTSAVPEPSSLAMFGVALAAAAGLRA